MQERRIVILGNAGGGKSTFARRLAAETALPLIEYDARMWTPEWTLRPAHEVLPEHDAMIAQDNWIIEGMGHKEMLRPRLARATDVIHIDLPLWQHFWLIAERQIAWTTGTLDHPPAGNPTPSSMKDTFQLVNWLDTEWMPDIRSWVDEARAWATVTVYKDVSDIPGFRDTGNPD